MKAAKTLAHYQRLRTQAVWRLLAAHHAPVIIALLQTYLYDNERSLPASVLLERFDRDLALLRAQGEDLPQTAQSYLSAWLAEGYLLRSFPEGAAEEVYELSGAGINAIRFVMGLLQPHARATESRLSVVISQLQDLAQDTDKDKFRRIDRLLKERARIDQEIAAIEQGQLRVMPKDRAVERCREIISLADELLGDFRRVRDEFEQLNRDLREKILEEANRGEVLEALFAGMDVISESEAGKTFAAFWRLLIDQEQSSTLESALEEIMSRHFVRELTSRERQFLLNLTKVLLEQGGVVHDVLSNFAGSLRHFVQSREYLEFRRLNTLLREAQLAALAVKDKARARQQLNYHLHLSSSAVHSLSQWRLYDPSQQADPAAMQEAEAATVDLAAVGNLLAQSEIDYRRLQENVRQVLLKHSQASVAQVLEDFPATQGLGSVLGLLSLASRDGIKTQETEMVQWQGQDGLLRRARIDKLFFVRDKHGF
ncbi:DUF3375 domain-containing protein [Suttonella indologenes]|uniref:Protein of uncharacterized function (DUF3375) n=1 Tax=Suttonella indologenes TaxID=13276 RepID=A0A380MJ99_9GAMM|nr:DUF3375 domain-containing protein [Suttonella indologenes]SUO91614.1 Protein of uncharacterised function (DUF3375) [Suttonella indologenes]